MGGGLKSSIEINESVKSRCEFVISIKNNLDLIVCTSSFTLNLPPKLDDDGYIVSEASGAYNYLQNKKIGVKTICEQFSHDTLGSLFFIFDMILPAYNAKNIYFISSDYHCERVQIQCEWFKELLNINNYNYNLKFVAVKSFGINNDRFFREKKSIENFKIFKNKISSRLELIRYIHESHSCYNYTYSGDRSVKAMDY
jgi:hypothetical protein